MPSDRDQRVYTVVLAPGFMVASRTQAEETRAIRFRPIHQTVRKAHPRTIFQLDSRRRVCTVVLAFGLKVSRSQAEETRAILFLPVTHTVVKVPPNIIFPLTLSIIIE